jgi:hypothetical protein
VSYETTLITTDKLLQRKETYIFNRRTSAKDASHRVLDSLHSLLGAEEVVHGHLLVLVLLVVLEEALDLLEPVGGQLLDVGVVPELGVVRAHRNHLVVLLALQI